MSVASDEKKSDGGVFEIISIVVQALALALVVQMFLFQPFNIPSGSMEHTLRVGDFLFVSKYSYGYSRYSFSNKFLGVERGIIPFSGRIWGGEPVRGDIAVFREPSDDRVDYIKRVIGLPGDKIQMKQGVLYINGAAVKRDFDKDFDEIDYLGQEVRGKQYTETLPNGISYKVLKTTDDGPYNNTAVFEVPPGHYFMMGDNRDNSQDSRFLSVVGYVPAENLIGRARMIFFSHEGDSPVWQVWKWPWTLRFSRFFTLL